MPPSCLLKVKHIHLPFLEIDYYYDEKSDMDYIQNQDGTVIQLMDASSGLQSMIPLVVLRSYFAEWIYTNEEPRSLYPNWFFQFMTGSLSLYIYFRLIVSE